jgi:uncharacterized protein
MSFLHGVEVVTVQVGPRPYRVAATSVIGIVAPGVKTASAEYGKPILLNPNRTLASQGISEAPGENKIRDLIKLIYSIHSATVIAVPIETENDSENAFEQLRFCKQNFGFGPKILVYGGSDTPIAKMISVAEKLRAVCVFKTTPVQDTVVKILGVREPVAGELRQVASDRGIIVAPAVETEMGIQPADVVQAAVIARTDEQLGYHYSPSNKVVTAIKGVTVPMTMSYTDRTSDTNQLNAQGICTFLTEYGAGWRTWGNRNASFPAEQGVMTFISARRTVDVIEEAAESSALRYIDLPINRPLIDAILEDANAFIRSLLNRGAVTEGRYFYAEERNPPAEVAAGRLVINYEVLPVVPLETLRYEGFINVNLRST